ncbi:MAG TPA: hypothetical protein GX707_18105 [Epulopiscium sp.]|nr:hypothetical protein [Candidatus Epulonipiscium sp.]
MVTIEQKVELFSELLYQEIQNEIDDQTNQFNQKKTSLLEQAQASAKKKALAIYATGEKQVNRKRNELITLSKINSRKEIIETKEACVDQMMTKIEEKTKAFILTEDYKAYIENCMAQVMKLMGTDNPLEVFVMEEDMQRFKGLFNKENFLMNQAQSTMIGGVVVVDSKAHTRVDFSIRTRLNDMKPFIINQVMEALEEVGDYSEQ